MIVILGAGLAGLSTAYHLRDRDLRLLEREAEAGGLARSVNEAGFLFDFTGHLLHLRTDAVKALVADLLGDAMTPLERSAWIQDAGVLLPYPFQVNTADLPVEVRVRCLAGFAAALRDARGAAPGGFEEPRDRLPLSFLNVREPTGAYRLSFRDWAIATFGRGFAEQFFLPYNTKNFAADLATLSSDWLSWAIPRPELEDVLRGALGVSRKEFGYNPRFLYPAQGGIRRLPDALAARVPRLETDATVARIDAAARRVHLRSGEEIAYDALVATNPLPELAAMIDDLEPDARAAAARLRWCAVASFNFGLDAPLGHDRHWVYYPEARFPFYRVGFPSNLVPAMAPDGAGSVCAEVAYAPHAVPGADAEERVLDALIDAGAIPDRKRVRARRRLDLPYAYVLFDDARRAALPVLFRALLARDIIPVGRYGSWSYLSMEDTILQGMETARHLSGANAARDETGGSRDGRRA